MAPGSRSRLDEHAQSLALGRKRHERPGSSGQLEPWNPLKMTAVSGRQRAVVCWSRCRHSDCRPYQCDCPNVRAICELHSPRRRHLSASCLASRTSGIGASTRLSINVSGVRSSWLTFEKKVVLAWSISARASARLRSAPYARAFASPAAIWPERKSTNPLYAGW